MVAEATVTDYPLTLKEQAQWMLHRLTPGQGICNLGAAMAVDVRLRWWPLQESLNHLLRRHKALRATLRMDGSAPRKIFLSEDTPFPLETVAAAPEELDSVLAEASSAPFDVHGGLLTRARLILTPTGSVICIVLHHMVADYTSFLVMLSEFVSLYDAYANTTPVPPELDEAAPILLERDPDPHVVEYWARHLDGVDPAAMALAGARPISGRPTFAGDIVDHRLSAQAQAAVETLRSRTRLTANLVLLTAFYALLAKHGAGPDLVVGIPVDTRRAAHRRVVGFHASTLPIRVHVDPDIDLAELAMRVSRSFLIGLENGAASFEALQFSLGARSADWRAPLFRHMFNFRPVQLGTPPIAGTMMRGTDMRQCTSRLDMEWEVWPKPSGVEIFARFSTEVHDREFVATMLRRFDVLLVELAANQDGQPIGQVAGWTTDDRAVVADLNATERRWPPGTVLDAILANAGHRPEAVAIRDPQAAVPEVSYGELVAWAAKVARAVSAAGVQRGEVVGVHARRGPELAAAVLGVWSAGAAYLAIDHAYPVARLAAELDDSDVRVIFTAGELPGALLGGRSSYDLRELRGSPPAEQAGAQPVARDLAYVSYTSGSTGRPKGVEVTHGNVANVISHFTGELGLTAADRMLWLTTFAFDISALELLAPLSCGAAVVAAADEIRLRARALIDLAEAEGVTIIQATPTTCRFLANELHGRLPGCTLLVGVDAMSASLAARLLASGRRVLNVYGPTETTIWSTHAELRLPVPQRVPIGRPIANTAVHVLDAAGNQVPPGVPGELCITGDGVARGYRDAPELTAAKFRDDALFGRGYRTGDLVRVGTAGLEFIGRVDRQVKVRGHRVELTEVEDVLGAEPAVEAAVVMLAEDPSGDALLVAAIQSQLTGTAADELTVRLQARAAECLPAASVPARFTVLESLPLTGNGKVDQRALRAMLDGSGEPAQLPDDQLLRTLVLAFRSVLGDDRLGADANFFLSGGHSLLATRLAERISATLGVRIEFDAIFSAPSPRRLAELLRQAEPQCGIGQT